MASLTTVYVISVIVTSIAGMGSAFLGNKIYPLKGGYQPPPPTPAEVAAAVKKAEIADTEARKKADALASAELYQIKDAQKSKAESESEPEAESEAESEDESEAESEDESEAESKPTPEPEPESKPEPEQKPLAIEPPVQPTLPVTVTAENLKEVIAKNFNMDDEFANNVIDFIKTPVSEWNLIAKTPQELKKKFVKTLSHPNLNKCPANLLDVCKIVNIKYSNMKDLIDGERYTPYGDQTNDAVRVLSNSS
jgi:hypothetical protein